MMNITISIPTKAQIISGGFEVHVAATGASWSKSQLGDYADKKGVYIHHSRGKLLYIGKSTSGQFGTFGERLRREFQTLAAANSTLHQLLAGQKQKIQTYLIDLEDLDMMIDSGSIALTAERKALIMEQVLIGIYQPPGNIV